MPKYVYQRGGGPLLSWNNAAPQQTRAADAKSLGSLGGTVFSAPTLELPRAGAPEPLGNCGCKGTVSGLIGQPMGGYADEYIPYGGKVPGQYVVATPLSGIVDTVSNLSTPAKVGLGLAAYFLYKKLKKKR